MSSSPKAAHPKSRHIVAFGDMHCGHRVGLCPPAWQVPLKHGDASRTKRDKWTLIAHEAWQKFIQILDEVRKNGPITTAFYLGDGLDGRGERSGGLELLTPDRGEQVEMAVASIEEIRKRSTRDMKIRGVFGTGYHCGDYEDWENHIAKDAGFESIGSHDWAEAHGRVFDLKHFISSSSIPHGRATALLKERVWNLEWADAGAQPRAHTFLRAHTHAFGVVGHAKFNGFILPALQAMGSRHGSRKCSGTVDWGLLEMILAPNGDLSWCGHVLPLESQKAKVAKI